MNASLGEGPARQSFAAVAIVAVLIQTALLCCAWPLASIFSDATFWWIDHPYHQYQIELGRALLRQGLLVGYDPFFGGGTLGGVSFNASARLPVLVSALLPDSVSTAHLYGAYVLACALAAPAMAVWLAAERRCSRAQTVIVVLVAIAFWWCSALRWYGSAGLVSYVLACYFAPAYGAWAVRLVDRKGAIYVAGFVRLIAAGLVGAVGLWLHPLFAVLAAPAFFVFLLADRADVRWSDLVVRTAVIAAIAVVCNLPWVLAIRQAPNLLQEQPYQRAVGFDMLLGPLLGRWSAMGSFLDPVVVALLVAAPWIAGRRCAVRIAPYAALAAFFVVFSAFGGMIPALAALQPNRFAAAGFLIAGMGAAIVVGDAIPRISAVPMLPRYAAVVAAALLLAYTGREIAREVSGASHGHYGRTPPEITLPDTALVELASWIRANTSGDGRILFETSLGRVHGGGHVAGFLALSTQREFSGGAYPFNQPAQSFWDRSALGAPLDRLDIATFAARMDDDNVGWIVAHSPGLQGLVSRWDRAREVATIGPVRIYRIDRPLSYVATGSGRVVARSFNRVEVADVTGGTIVLRYHWVPGLHVTAPGRVEASDSSSNLAPLIRVVDAPAHFVLSTCARCVEP